MKNFIRKWILVIAMCVGIFGYLIYMNIPLSRETHIAINKCIEIAIPTMVFVMLYITFCKVDIRHIKLTKWHIVLALFQITLMLLICVALNFTRPISEEYSVLLESAFICIASPTATGSVVVLTERFGGNTTTTTAYTVISNLITAFCVPVMLSFISYGDDHSIIETFGMIVKRITPLLVIPLFLAFATQIYVPRIVEKIKQYKDLPLILWAVAMSLALAMTVRYIVRSNFSVLTEILIALVSLVVCTILFASGKKLGELYGERIGAGQGLAQRNTVFIIWLGTTFLSPTSAIAGGFYSICQNIFNSYQMWRHSKGLKI